MAPPVPILILAAGASRRMGGRDKLMERVRGQPLIRDRAEVALNAAERTGAEVFITLPLLPSSRHEALSGLPLQRIPVDADGMGASLGAGLHALSPEVPGVLVLLADMPDLSAKDLIQVMEGFTDRPRRGATADGTPGHPVLLPKCLFPTLGTLTGDQGARAVLRGEEVDLIPLPGNHAITDLDTPEAWSAWCKAQSDSNSANSR